VPSTFSFWEKSINQKMKANTIKEEERERMFLHWKVEKKPSNLARHFTEDTLLHPLIV